MVSLCLRSHPCPSNTAPNCRVVSHEQLHTRLTSSIFTPGGQDRRLLTAMSEGFQIFSTVRFDTALKGVAGSDLDYAGWNHKHASPFYLLDRHRDRLLRAAIHWQWEPVMELLAGDRGIENLARLAEEFVGAAPPTPLRVTIRITQDGVISFERSEIPAVLLENLFPRELAPPGAARLSPGQPANSPRYVLVLDDGLVPPSEYTHFKTSRREMYNAARQRANIKVGEAREVLLVNQRDKTIMEGSITTPYFWRGGRWVTPPVAKQFNPKEGSGGQDGTSRRWALERGLAVEEAVKPESVRHGELCWISNGARGFTPATISRE
ncbi:aminotransferase class IV-domain-containing protein [Stachybotrys elegans]|uniref:Aminotransferase class IV-domain-containing protein n=1 Tax=Stachybotrys elegans TaxID=80388 RepID=A0A8K0SZL2_9HYPO|nr:aminotransferase class IV-domain-containing protein [Stachybotrys elegans]